MRNHDFLERLIIGIILKKLLAKGADFEGRFMPVQKKKKKSERFFTCKKSNSQLKQPYARNGHVTWNSFAVR